MGKGGKEGGLSWSNFWDPCYLDHSSLLYREAFLLLAGGEYEVKEEVLFTLIWCLGWFLNKEGLGVG